MSLSRQIEKSHLAQKLQSRAREWENNRRDSPPKITHYGTIPIHNIPCEILGYIFEFCSGHNDTWHDRSDLRSLSASSLETYNQCPWTLTRVCHQWRLIAIDCTSLWCTVRLGKASSYKLLELQLKRSKDSPLSIFAGVFEGITAWILMTHTERWSCFRVDQDVPLDPYLGQHRFPQLKQLALRRYHGILPFVQSCPNVTEIALHVQYLSPYGASAVGFPWHQFHSLTLRYQGDPHHLLATLDMATQLTSLRLRFEYSHEQVRPTQKIIVMHKLRALTLSGAGCLIPFTDFLACPALEDLEHRADYELSRFADFIGRSQCQLRSLLISIFWGGAFQDLSRLLHPTLESVQLACLLLPEEYAMITGIAENLVQWLSDTENQPKALHTLRLKIFPDICESQVSALAQVVVCGLALAESEQHGDEIWYTTVDGRDGTYFGMMKKDSGPVPPEHLTNLLLE